MREILPQVYLSGKGKQKQENIVHNLLTSHEESGEAVWKEGAQGLEKASQSRQAISEGLEGGRVKVPRLITAL